MYLKCVEDDVAAVGCCVLGSLSTDPMQERTMCPVRHTIRVPRWTRTPAAPYMTTCHKMSSAHRSLHTT